MVTRTTMGHAFSSISKGASKFLRKSVMTAAFLGASMFALGKEAKIGKAAKARANIETSYHAKENLASLTRADLPGKVSASYIRPYGMQKMQEVVDMVLAPSIYDDVFEKAEQETGVPALAIKAYCVNETGLDPTLVSPTGPVGICQYAAKTARMAGLTVNSEIDERYDAEKSIMSMGRLMAYYLSRTDGRFLNDAKGRFGVLSYLHGKTADGAHKQYNANMQAVLNYLGVQTTLEKGAYAKVKVQNVKGKMQRLVMVSGPQKPVIQDIAGLEDSKSVMENLQVYQPVIQDHVVVAVDTIAATLQSDTSSKISGGDSVAPALVEAGIIHEETIASDTLTARHHAMDSDGSAPQENQNKQEPKQATLVSVIMPEQWNHSAVQPKNGPPDLDGGDGNPGMAAEEGGAYTAKQRANLFKKMQGKTVHIGGHVLTIEQEFAQNKDDVTKSGPSHFDVMLNAFEKVYGKDKAAKYLHAQLNKYAAGEGDIIFGKRASVTQYFSESGQDAVQRPEPKQSPVYMMMPRA